MRLHAISINNNYYSYRNSNVKNRVSTPVNNIAFNGIFDKNAPSLQDKFEVGLNVKSMQKPLLMKIKN